jgi:hypothetical protein
MIRLSTPTADNEAVEEEVADDYLAITPKEAVKEEEVVHKKWIGLHKWITNAENELIKRSQLLQWQLLYKNRKFNKAKQLQQTEAEEKVEKAMRKEEKEQVKEPEKEAKEAEKGVKEVKEAKEGNEWEKEVKEQGEYLPKVLK